MGLEWGSVSVAIWTMICSIMSLVLCGYTLMYTDPQTAPYEKVAVIYGSLIVLHALLFLSAVLLIIGTVRMNDLLLRPYLVLETLAFLAYTGLEVALIVALADGSWKYFPLFSSITGSISTDSFKFVYVTAAGMIPLWLLLTVVCLRCVVSLQRDLRIYRARAQFAFHRWRGSTPDDIGSC